jgi:dihydroxyacetone kinase DhaKLM complex PTS-EIIA-like component DhaM
MSIRGLKLTSHLVFVWNEGFSIGAHAAGVAGSFIQEMNNGQKIARITGLDPAGIGFDEDRLETVLDKSDADFVDVI